MTPILPCTVDQDTVPPWLKQLAIWTLLGALLAFALGWWSAETRVRQRDDLLAACKASGVLFLEDHFVLCERDEQ